MAAPNQRFSKVHRNNRGLDMEKKKAAGTAHDTVGQPGTQMPMIAKTMKISPSARKTMRLMGAEVMA